MSHKIRVGVVGTSPLSEFMYLSTLRNHPHATLVAVCGRDRERTSEIAAKYEIPHSYTNSEDMINWGDLEAIIVATPDDLHYEITMMALEAGLHVMCEKPLASTEKQAREMLETAQEMGVIHMVTFTYRWMPFVRYVQDLLDQAIIGRCYQAEFCYLSGGARNKQYRWRYDSKRANGVLADMGSHMIDMARWFLGDISRVSAQLGTFVDCTGADGEPMVPANDSAFLLVEFANGAHGMIHVSSVTHVAGRDMHQQVNLYGEGGSLEMDVIYRLEGVDVSLMVARNEDNQFHKLDIPASYWGSVNAADVWDIFQQQSVGPHTFIDAIREKEPASPTFYDGFKTQQVIEAAIQSHHLGKWISMEDPVLG